MVVQLEEEEEFWGSQWLSFQESTCGITSTSLSCGVGNEEEGEHQRKRRDELGALR